MITAGNIITFMFLVVFLPLLIGAGLAYYLIVLRNQMKCPGCGKKVDILTRNGSISVNVESKGQVKIKGLIILGECENPLCEWSNVNMDDCGVEKTYY